MALCIGCDKYLEIGAYVSISHDQGVKGNIFVPYFCFPVLLGVKDRLSMFRQLDGFHLGFSLSIRPCAAE